MAANADLARVHALALDCIREPDPATKVALTQAASRDIGGLLGALADSDCLPDGGPPVLAISAPGRPDRPRLVMPRQVAQRKLSQPDGRAALVHAVAHIEFNAINLAWDAVYRFRAMPARYYRDWVAVADDEARHFTLLAGRLAALGHVYGDFDAHNGLWEMAVKTADDKLARMALVPRVLEARGLDVTPGMIERLRSVGDDATADILELILREEVTHVAAGTRWFEHCCRERGVEPEATFLSLLAEVGGPVVRPPFNLEARRAAGFSPTELDALSVLGAGRG